MSLIDQLRAARRNSAELAVVDGLVAKGLVSLSDVPEGLRQPGKTHVTQLGESLMGMALRELGSEARWTEVRDLNASRFQEMGPHDYYPVGTKLAMPESSEEQMPLFGRVEQ